MHIAVGGDHGGFSLKKELVTHLKQSGHQVQDVGAHTFDPADDYPDFAQAVAQAVVILTVLWFHFPWWMCIPLALIFAFTFWLVFDCLHGYLRTGFILYIGDSVFDKKMRWVFLYNKPIFGWEQTGAVRQVFFKMFWLGILIPSYFSLLNT